MRSGINFGMLLRVMGLLVIIEAAFMAVPLVTSLVYGDGDTMAFVVSILVAASVGALMTFGVRPGVETWENGKDSCSLRRCGCFFGVRHDSVSDLPHAADPFRCFFEAMSGFTTTGASVMQEIDGLSHAIHMWRSLMQWIGVWV